MGEEGKVEILFKTRAELEGAQRAAEALEKQIGAAKALGKEYAKLEEQLKRTQESIAGASGKMAEESEAKEKAGAAARELAQEETAAAASIKELEDSAAKTKERVRALGEESGQAAIQKGLLKNAVRGLSAEFPVLGMALRALANPWTLLATVIGFAIKKVTEYTAKAKEASDAADLAEMAERSVGSMRRLAAGFARAGEDFRRELAGIQAAAEDAAGAFETLQRRVAAVAGMRGAVEDAQTALRKAQVQERVRKGEISPAQGIEEIAKIETQTAAGKTAAEIEMARQRYEQAKHARRVTEGEVRTAQEGMPSDVAMAAAQRKALEDRERANNLDQETKKKEVELRQKRNTLQDTVATSYGAKQWQARKEMAQVDEEIAQQEKLRDDAKRQAESSEGAYQSLAKVRQEKEGKTKAAAGRVRALSKEEEGAKLTWEDLKKYRGEAGTAQQAERELKAKAEAEESRKAVIKEYDEARQKSYETGEPIPPETQRKYALLVKEANEEKAAAARARPAAHGFPTWPRRVSGFERRAFEGLGAQSELEPGAWPVARFAGAGGGAVQAAGAGVERAVAEEGRAAASVFESLQAVIQAQTRMYQMQEARIRSLEQQMPHAVVPGH